MSGTTDRQEKTQQSAEAEILQMKKRMAELALSVVGVNAGAVQIETLVIMIRAGADAAVVEEQIRQIKETVDGVNNRLFPLLNELAEELDGEELDSTDG